MSLEVDSAHQTEFSMESMRNGYGLFYLFKEKRQLWVRPMGGWNSTLQAAWYVRHAHGARLYYVYDSILWKIEKRQLWVRPIEWLKLIFTSCVMHQTRSLGVLIPYFIYNMVFVN